MGESIQNLVVHRRDPHDVYIGRPSKWGNPFIIGVHGTRKEVCGLYRDWIYGRVSAPYNQKPPSIKEIQLELRGKILGCHCHPKLCHGLFLAHIANKPKGLFNDY